MKTRCFIIGDFRGGTTIGGYPSLHTGNVSELLKITGDNYVDFGMNTQGGVLRVGGNSNNDTSKATLCTSYGNLFLDAKLNNNLYLNYFSGTTVFFGNGVGTGTVGSVDYLGNASFSTSVNTKTMSLTGRITSTSDIFLNKADTGSIYLQKGTNGISDSAGVNWFKPRDASDNTQIINTTGGFYINAPNITLSNVAGVARLSIDGTGNTVASGTFSASGGILGHASLDLALTGGTMSSNLSFSDTPNGTKKGIFGTMAANDQWFVGGGSVASDNGYLEIATGDGGIEPIYVRQYSGGSPLTGTLVRTASLLDATGNTVFPGTVIAPNFTGTASYATTAGSAPANGGTATSATNLQSVSNPGQWWISNTWDGTYWQVTSNHGSPVNVGHATNAGYATSAGSAPANGGNAATLTNFSTVSAVNPDTKGTTGVQYFISADGSQSIFPSTDGALFQQAHQPAPTTWGSQIAQDYRNGHLKIRGLNNANWTTWLSVIDSSSIASQSVNYANSAGSSGSATTSTTSTYVVCPDGSRDPSTFKPQDNPNRVRYDFTNAGSSNGGGNYSGVMTYSPWSGTSASTGNCSYQLSFSSSAQNGGTPYLSLRNGIDTTWNGWYQIARIADLPTSLPANGGNSTSANGITPHWSGVGGQPSWLLGGESAAAVNVYNPSNFNVSYANNAGAISNFVINTNRSDGNNYSLAGRTTGIYAIAGAGTNGPGGSYLNLIHCDNGSDVAFQIAGGYSSDSLSFRGTSALQNGTGYTPWRSVIHNGNIGSQSVSYANSAGSAPANGGTSTFASRLNPISGDGGYKLAYTADAARTNAGAWGRVVMLYDGNGQTYGVRCDRADYSDSAGNSNTVGGLGISASGTANTIVQRDSGGCIFGANVSISNVIDNDHDAVSYIYDNGDGLLRKKSLGLVQGEIMGTGIPGAYGNQFFNGGSIFMWGTYASGTLAANAMSQFYITISTAMPSTINAAFVTYSPRGSNAVESISARPYDTGRIEVRIVNGPTAQIFDVKYFVVGH